MNLDDNQQTRPQPQPQTTSQPEPIERPSTITRVETHSDQQDRETKRNSNSDE